MDKKRIYKLSSRQRSVVTKSVLIEIWQALKNIKWGSVEIFVQGGKVTQITERNIKKTDHDIGGKIAS